MARWRRCGSLHSAWTFFTFLSSRRLIILFRTTAEHFSRIKINWRLKLWKRPCQAKCFSCLRSSCEPCATQTIMLWSGGSIEGARRIDGRKRVRTLYSLQRMKVRHLLVEKPSNGRPAGDAASEPDLKNLYLVGHQRKFFFVHLQVADGDICRLLGCKSLYSSGYHNTRRASSPLRRTIKRSP